MWFRAKKIVRFANKSQQREPIRLQGSPVTSKMDLITQLFNQENLSPFSWCEANTTTQPVKWAKQTETTAPTLKQRYFSFQSVKITRQVIWQKRYIMWKTRLVTYSVVKKMKPCYKKTTESNGQSKQGRISLSRINSQDWPRQNFSF